MMSTSVTAVSVMSFLVSVARVCATSALPTLDPAFAVQPALDPTIAVVPTFEPAINSGALHQDGTVTPAEATGSSHLDQLATRGSGVPAVPAPFGAEGQWRLNLLGGYMNNMDGVQSGQGIVGFSWFFVEGVSLDLEMNAQWFMQSTGGNTAGGGLDLLFRWHFLKRETWSLYLDGGCGLLFTGSDVPSGGSTTSFTPQAGAGITFSPDEHDRWRVMAGARWYHISNARTSSGNPGLDGMQLYAGITLPF